MPSFKSSRTKSKKGLKRNKSKDNSQDTLNENASRDSKRSLDKKNENSDIDLNEDRSYDLRDLKSKGVKVSVTDFKAGSGSYRVGTRIKASYKLDRNIQAQLDPRGRAPITRTRT